MTKNKPYVDRADKLKALRGDVPVDVFAGDLGINLTTYYRYERGETPISDGHLKLAKIISDRRQIEKTAVSEPELVYDKNAGWKPRSIEELTGVPKGLGMGHAVELLARIYQSKNQEVIRAIFANLQVCSKTVDQDDEIAALKRDVDEFKVFAREHAKKNAYYGEDRRSGVERRRIIGAGPNGSERRSGADRRETTDNGAKL